jgi:hypothetical protein
MQIGVGVKINIEDFNGEPDVWHSGLQKVNRSRLLQHRLRFYERDYPLCDQQESASRDFSPAYCSSSWASRGTGGCANGAYTERRTDPPLEICSNGSACTCYVVVNRCEAMSYIARENVLIRSSDPKKLDAKTEDSRYKRVYPSTRSTTPLRVSSGNKLDARSLPPFPISCTIFGQIECKVQNWTNRRSRFRHS